MWCCNGDDVTLKCQVTKKKYGVKWLINSMPVDTRDLKKRCVVQSEDTCHSLTLKNALISDTGTVTAICETAVCETYLEVVPIGIDIGLKDIKIIEHESATFTCISNKAEIEVNFNNSNYIYHINDKLITDIMENKWKGNI